MLVMRKADFLVGMGDEYNVRRGTHVEVTGEQGRFVSANPPVNGPKVALFLLQTSGYAPDVQNRAWCDMLRKEAEAQGQGAAPYVESAKPEPVKPTPPAEAPKAEVSEAEQDLRKTLASFADKDALVAHVTTTLGIDAGKLDKRWGADKIVAFAVSEKMAGR